MVKEVFLENIKKFAQTLTDYVSTNSGDWSIKGFIDIKEPLSKGVILG